MRFFFGESVFIPAKIWVKFPTKGVFPGKFVDKKCVWKYVEVSLPRSACVLLIVYRSQVGLCCYFKQVRTH